MIRSKLAERVHLDAPAFLSALAECGAPQWRTEAMEQTTALSHEFRVSQHLKMMESFGAPVTFETCMRLGDQRAKAARKMRNKAMAGSLRHREWRKAYLDTARAFYTLARRSIQQVDCAWCNAVMRKGSATQPVSHGMCEPCRVKFLNEEATVIPAVELATMKSAWPSAIARILTEGAEAPPTSLEI